VVPGAEALQFRDVQGVSDKVGYLQSIGNNPTDFRIYKTVDGGATWTMQFQNQNPGAFLRLFRVLEAEAGYLAQRLGERSVPGSPHHRRQDLQDISNNMPPALPGEASFAASGTCVATQERRTPGLRLAVRP